MKKIIEFHIGDWSGDGHGQSDTYLVISNKTLQELRELYLAACAELGVRLDGHQTLTFDVPCEDYEDSQFPQELYKYLKGRGVEVPEFALYDDEDENSPYIPESEEFFDLILAFIKWKDPTVTFEKIKGETFHFYGFDKQKRHIGFFGYGLKG